MARTRRSSRVTHPLLVDTRRGSRELHRPLVRLGCNAVLSDLRYPGDTKSGPDFQWSGNGPLGLTTIGVERKTVSEMLGSIQDDRFTAGQLPKLCAAFHPWAVLLIEGDIRPGPDGELQQAFVVKEWGGPKGRGNRQYVVWRESRTNHSYAQFQRFLATLRHKAGVTIVQTRDLSESLLWLHAEYWWWQKRWSEHKSVYRIRENKPDAAMLTPQTLTRRLAAQIPDIYWVRSKAVAEKWRTPRMLGYFMWKARVDDWTGIDGIGQGIATKVCDALRGKTGKKGTTDAHR